MLKNMEKNVGARMHPCLTPFEMGKLPDRDPFVLHLTLLTFMELAEDGEKLERGGDSQDAPGFSTVHHG